ncbi:MAG: 30S ribosomal protein S6--L-glutamate ligase, partial [Saprospiraceae bacterium]|nr:30S ribosomal protein S6--L-glutamate ligase [Saprospiraceae bacterium]
IRLSDLEERVVKKAVQVMGLHIAGVDLLRSRRGPLVMEVNASPGLEGIETITGVDIAGRIIEFVENGARRLSSARTARTL